jgi:PIN domain nuclease of toxin-antitoxin system
LSEAPPSALALPAQYLLDTHALIWWLLGDPSLSVRARQIIGDPANQIFVSAASGWEISTKFRIAKLPSNAAPLVHGFNRTVLNEGFLPLPISIPHACMSGLMRGAHKDPFDRMLAAQSLSERMPIISNDALLDQFNITRIW